MEEKGRLGQSVREPLATVFIGKGVSVALEKSTEKEEGFSYES